MVMYGAVEEEVVEMDNHMKPHFCHEHRLCNVGMQTVPVENLWYDSKVNSRLPT
ncbi:hypothetical protein DPMN_112855 [Dreissena polymorpha]|uniref:Uncharacterized protein n=1 Tax=Dreissena polymorpha TaxID=45954 RepID=A0A9D4KH30_DREPO|nr:hypothetical protein DPMN_112855 [Dreissena polymorpha]